MWLTAVLAWLMIIINKKNLPLSRFFALYQNILFYSFRDPVLIVTFGDGFCLGFDCLRGIAHSDSKSSQAEHRKVIEVVSDCHNLL